MKVMAEFFINNFKFTLVLTFGLVVFGAMGLLGMRAETFPMVDLGQVRVTTLYRGASAQDIETQITKPLEDELRTVSGLKDVQSISQSGRSYIFIRIDIDNVKDKEQVISDIQRAIDRVPGLPQDLESSPLVEQVKSEEMPVIEVAIVGDNTNRRRDLLADLLKEELEDNKRVLGVRLSGFQERHFQILIDRNKLNSFHVGINEVFDRIQKRNISVPGGLIKGEKNQILVRMDSRIANKEEIENILIRSNFSGEGVYIKDVAQVLDSEQEARILAMHNGEEATLLTVTKKGGEDTIKLTQEVMEKLTIFKERNQDFEFHTYLDEAKKVKNRIEILGSNAFWGLVLVMVFLLLFLPGPIGLVTSLSLPLAVMGTLGYMLSTDMTLNTITIMALVISLGMLVDNAVVISENFARFRIEGKSPKMAAVDTIALLWAPITATALTTIAAFLPMLVTTGVMGQFIRYIPVVVTVSLIICLLEGFFLLPIRLILLENFRSFLQHKKGHIKVAKENWFESLQKKFEVLMSLVIKKRYLVFGFFTLLLLMSIFTMVKLNRFILFPPDQVEQYVARYETPVGTRIEETKRLMGLLSNKIKEKLGDDAVHIVARAGISQTTTNDPKYKEGDNVGIILIKVSEHAQYHRASSDVLKSLRQIDAQGFLDVSYEAIVNGPPVGFPIQATFRSNDPQKLDEVIDLMMKKLSTHNGIKELKTDDVYGDDEVFILLNYEKTDQLGLNPKSIADTVRMAISGVEVSSVNLLNKDVELMIRMRPEFKKDLKDLKDLMIMDSRGNLVPLETIAKLEVKKGTPQIKRFDFKRAKTLMGDVDDIVMTSVKANNLLTQYYEEVTAKYPEVTLVFGGQKESTKESMRSLATALVLSLIAIFALLVLVFNSFFRPVIIMSTIPLGLVGVSISFYLHDRPLSFLAMIGVVGLGGIIVNSGIVLISFIEDMKSLSHLTIQEILIKASGLRLRAVLVTSLTTISGLIPTAYGIGGMDASLVPITLALAWGLFSGTFLTLIWVPCAYAIWEDIVFKIKKMSGIEATEELV